MTPTRLWTLALTATLLASCSDSTEPTARRGPELFQTDSLSYTLRATDVYWEGRIAVEFTNETDEQVSFPNCNGVTALVFEKRVAGEWVPTWGPGTYSCLGAPINVAAGATFSDTIQVMIGRPGQPWGYDLDADALTGTFRIVWQWPVHDYSAGTPYFGTPLPLEHRVSNPFEMRVENP